MGTLKLCRDRQAQNPFFLEGLSVSVYTLEELCYAIESNLFLLDEKWIGTSLFQWLEKELGEADLTAHLKNSYRKSKDVYECAELILSASGFYTVERLRQIDEMLTRMRGKSPMERRKMKADYFLSEKKYRHAAYGYLELLQQENLIYMTEELQGESCTIWAWHMRVCFCFRKRQKCLQQLIRKTDQSRAGIVICML